MFREFYQFMWMNRSYWEPRLKKRIMKSSGEVFKDAIDTAFTSQPNVN